MFWFKFYIPSNLGLVNICEIIVIDKDTKENNTTQNNCDKVSHIVVDFSNRDGETSVIYTASV